MSADFDFHGGVSEWHGWRVKGRSMHVGRLPGRKQVCLYMLDGGRMDVLAYFRSEDRAREALAHLDAMARATGMVP